VIKPNQPPAFLVPTEPVNSEAPSRMKVIIRKKKTAASERDDRREEMKRMKVIINHPMR
jgi:hypothetical protein